MQENFKIDDTKEQRHKFLKNLKFIFKNLNFKVNWINFVNLKYLLSGIGSVNINNLTKLKNTLSENNLKVINIDLPYFACLYFEASPELMGLVIAPKIEIVSLDHEILNQSQYPQIVYALQNYGKKNNIQSLTLLDRSTTLLLSNCIDYIKAEMLGITFFELDYLMFENSHKKYKEYYMEFKNKKRIYDGNYFNITNNVIELFARVYYNEIKIIGELINDKNISIHDIGTNVAHFPLLLSVLSQDKLFGKNFTKIIASDIGWTGEKHIKKVIQNYTIYRSIDFIKFDLIKEYSLIPETDVTILNDVLEHLPDDNKSLEVLLKLWDKTKKLLIAHVPFENAINPSWAHFIIFNASKIRNWADKLPNATFMSDKYFEDDKKSITHYGYLVALKK